MDAVKQTNKVEVRELNAHLICKVCGGYLIDACTLVECMHSFCRGCILKQFRTKNRCPTCNIAVKTRGPNVYLSPDPILQRLVYKVLPNVYHEELQRRRVFNMTLGYTVPNFAANFGLGHEHYTSEDTISLSLHYYSANPSEEDKDGSDGTSQTMQKRYLQCPAAVTIRHLKKFIRMKYGLSNEHKVDLIYEDECLRDDFTLMDVAYTFKWKRMEPMRFSYRIFQSPLCAARTATITSTSTASLESVSTELAAEPASPFTPSADNSWDAVFEIDVQNNGGEGPSTESSEPPPKKQRMTADASIIQKQFVADEQASKDAAKSKSATKSEAGEKRKQAKMAQPSVERRAERVSSEVSLALKEGQKASTSAAVGDQKDSPKESSKKAKFGEKIKGEEDDSKQNDKAKGAKMKEEKARGGKKKGKHKHKRPVIVSPTILHNPDDLMKLKVKLNPVSRAVETPGHHSRHHHHSKHHHTKHRKSSGSSTETSSSSTAPASNKERLLQMRAVRRKTKKPPRSEKSIEEIFQKQKASLLVPPSTITVSKVTSSGSGERRSLDGTGSQIVQTDLKRPSLEIMLVSCKKPAPGSPTTAQAPVSGAAPVPAPAAKNEEQKCDTGHSKAKDDKVPTGYGVAKSKDTKSTPGYFNHKGKDGQPATGFFSQNKSKDEKPASGHNHTGNKPTTSNHSLAKGKDDKVTPDRSKSAKPVSCYYSEPKNGDSKLASASFSIAKKDPARKRPGVPCYIPTKNTKPLPGTIPFAHMFKNEVKTNKINMDNGLTITPKIIRVNQGSSSAPVRSKSPSLSISMKVKQMRGPKSQEPRPPATSSPTFWQQTHSDKVAVGAATGSERRDNFGALDLSGRSSRKSESSSSGASTGRHSPADSEVDIERPSRVTNGQKVKSKPAASASQHTENGSLPATGMSNLKTLSDAAVRILMDAETKATTENVTSQTNGNKTSPNTNNNNNNNNSSQFNNNNTSSSSNKTSSSSNKTSSTSSSSNKTNNSNGHESSSKNNNGVSPFRNLHQQSTQSKMPSYSTASALRIPVPHAPLLHPANRGVPRLNEIVPRGRGGHNGKPVPNMGVRHIPNPSALFRQQSMNKHASGQQTKPVAPPAAEKRNGDDCVTSKSGAVTTATTTATSSATVSTASETVAALPVSSAPIKKIENMTRDIEKVAAGLAFRAVEAGLI